MKVLLSDAAERYKLSHLCKLRSCEYCTGRDEKVLQNITQFVSIVTNIH